MHLQFCSLLHFLKFHLITILILITVTSTIFVCGYRRKNDEFAEHGLKVVQHVMENEGLLEFERVWRQHFLDTMKPAFLPSLWSVDHSHEELISMGNGMKFRAQSVGCDTTTLVQNS